jgi:hypothetical protein
MNKLSRQTTLIFSMFAVAHSATFASSLQDEFSAWSQGRFGEAITAYDQMPAAEQSKPGALFVAGASYFKRHDFQRAKPLLLRAASGQLAPRQAQTAQTILAHIQTLEQLCPPFQRSYKKAGFTINLYAGKNTWSDLLAAQMPQFLDHAIEAFGNETAEVNFYLFDERPPYDVFFSAWKTNESQPELHRGTGTMHMVEFCKFYPNGTEVGAANVNDLYSRVLHEYSHALCHTIYGDRFGWDCPQWLNEGMADYFGWKYRPELYAKQSELLQKRALTSPALSYEQLSHHLYQNDPSYLPANVLVIKLFEGQNVSCYRQIINAAKANGGNFEAAVQQVTGKDPREVYASIVRDYWR